MLFTRFYDEDLAQASYFIGCQATGEAVVVDPRRDIAIYLKKAENNGMTIVAVTETHPRRLPLRLQGAGGGNRSHSLPLRRRERRLEIRLRGRSSTTEARSRLAT